MPIPSAGSQPPRRGLVLSGLLFMTAACWLPYFAKGALPIHDALFGMASFHCFYSEAFFQGELARWFPFGNYGMPADFYQLALQPTQYAVGLIGLACGVEDTLLLARIAMLFNELLVALGLWLLGRELYAHPLTPVLVTIGGVLTLSWFEQAMFNLFTFYLLPLVFFFLVRFFKTAKPGFLCIAGIVEVCSLLGNVVYVAPLHFWMLAIFSLIAAGEYPGALKSLLSLRALANPWLWGFLAITAVVGAFLAGMPAELAVLTPGRDVNTGLITRHTFLNYGRPPMLIACFGLIAGGMPHGPNTYYAGLLPLAMFAYALPTERRRTFVAFATVCLALIWLSLGGTFASLCFYVPGMWVFRHIALTYGIIGLLLSIGGGYGFDRIALRLSRVATGESGITARRFLGVAAIAGVMLADYVFSRLGREPPRSAVHPEWRIYFAFRLAAYFAALASICLMLRRVVPPHRKAMPAWILGLAFLIDVGSFRVQVFQTMPTVATASIPTSLFQAQKLTYQPIRGGAPSDERGFATLDLLARKLPYESNSRYCLLYWFAGFDPCRPLLRTDVLSRGIYEMISTRGGKIEPFPGELDLPSGDLAFARSLGCGFPKLRLTDRPIFARTDSEAIRLFIDVRYYSANRLRANVANESPRPAWLVYADAWSPIWKASVNGQPVPVRRANLGFKAVQVEPGTHDVEFTIEHGGRTVLAYGTALIGTAAGLVLCGALLGALFAPLASLIPRRPAIERRVGRTK